MSAPRCSAAALVVLAATLGSAGLAARQPHGKLPPLMIQSMYGRDLYQFYCGNCHGADARGSGPLAHVLTVDPPDLTMLAIRNGGVWPRARVEAVVTGTAEVPRPVRGTREMPAWGLIFRGLDPDEARNRARIANIVAYVESLQVKYAVRSENRRGHP